MPFEDEYDNDNTTTCDECEGTGRFIYDHEDEPSDETCFNCDGSGRVESTEYDD